MSEVKVETDLTGIEKPEKKTFRERFETYLAGLVAGSAENDPAAVTTYSVAGATTGLAQIWLMVLATPMLIAVQAMCARIGNITRKGLTEVLLDNFPALLVYLSVFLLLITTIIMIGADMIGVSSAFELVTGVPMHLWIVPVALVVWFAVLFSPFKKLQVYLGILSVAFLSYFFDAVLARPNWLEIAKAFFIPTIQMNPSFMLSALAILGATFTPPLFFWQAKEEVEEEPATRSKQLWRAKKANRLLAPGFIFAQAMTVFIMISTAAVLFTHHKEIKTAADAAKALEPFLGPAARYVFAAGIIGAGLVAIPVLSASAGYMVAEAFHWRQSLSEKIDSAKGFYIIITLSLFVGVEIALTDINPVQAMYYSQALAGLTGPVLMALLLIVANRKRVMGRLTNGWFENLFGGLALVILTVLAVVFLVQTAQGG